MHLETSSQCVVHRVLTDKALQPTGAGTTDTDRCQDGMERSASFLPATWSHGSSTYCHPHHCAGEAMASYSILIHAQTLSYAGAVTHACPVFRKPYMKCAFSSALDREPRTKQNICGQDLHLEDSLVPAHRRMQSWSARLERDHDMCWGSRRAVRSSEAHCDPSASSMAAATQQYIS